jgi:signal transduction histidine kinase/ActR/RegA family two-component response regulator
MSPPALAPSPLRVLLRAATGRDSVMASDILGRAGIATTRCENMQAVVAELENGAGALLLAEEALSDPGAAGLIRALSSQPAWSDLPLLVLARQGANSRGIIEAMDMPANVTVLERPMRVASLITVVRSALRARQRQYQLRSLLDGLRESDQRKTEFLATLAHELRNPMAPLSTALALLQRMDPEPGQAQQYYELMDRQVRHMVRLVDDLMEISRVTRAQIDLVKEPVAICEVIREAVELSQPLMDAPGHQLNIHCVDKTLTVNGDRVRLVQVFSNLLNNAAKYTFENGRIDLHAERDGGLVRVRIRDNGVGIPEEMLESIFGMFVQVNGTARAAQGGLGIGLTLVRNLVELHGGTVQASSPGTGLGTEVTVTLPLLGAQAAIAPEPASEPAKESLRDRILVVDDNRDAADSLAALLETMGASTSVAYDGQDALEKAVDLQPSIAILDIGMPRMDGYELARRLRADPRHDRMALVALTGWGQDSDRERIASAGFNRHLLKPVDIGELTHALSQLSTKFPDARA